MICFASSGRGRRRNVARRSAFTLFELILAIALSVTLVALIGTAINLYLTQVDASRTEVEEAQLARSILTMIADDIRATAIYKPQDVSAIQQLQAASAEFDVDSIDDQRRGGGGGGSGGGSGGSGGGGGSSSSGAPSSGMGGGSGSGGGSSMRSGSGASSGGGSSSMTGGVATADSTMPLGLTGSLLELYVDTTRLPRREELFATVTGYTNAPIGVPTSGMAASSTRAAASSTAPRPSDLKSVRYFVRQGEAIEQGSAAATSLVGEQQLRAGGLVRQEIPRSMRVWAEQSGNSAILDSGQSLIAPEVVRIEFRYFDGAQIADVWEMVERNSLPVAIEVRLWIAPASEAASINMAGSYNVVNLATTAREYRQTVYLPMAQLANSAMSGMGGASGMGGSSSGGASSGGSSAGGPSTNSSSGGSGSQFGSSSGQQ